MDERVVQFRVGVVVITAALVTGILVFLFSDGLTSTYPIYMDFPTAPGVAVNTPVRKNGILIGRVTDVDTKEEGGVRLTAKIKSGEKLYSGEVCRIGSASFLGDAVLEFLPGPTGQRGELIQPNDVLINGVVQRNPLELIEFAIELRAPVEEALVAFRDAANEVGQFTQSLNQTLSNDTGDLKTFMSDVRQLTSKLGTTLDNFNQVMTNVNEVIGDDEVKTGLKQTVAQLPETFSEARAAIQEMKNTVASFQQVSQRAEANLKNLEGLTGPLGENGDQIVAELQQSIAGINRLVAQVNQFAEAFGDSQGSLQMLMRDPRLYQEFLQAIQNFNQASRQFQPILSNVRVLSDKIARDPSVIIKGSNGMKGYLPSRDRLQR